MKKACHILLKIGFVLDLIAAIVMPILAIIMFVVAGSMQSTEPQVQEEKLIFIYYGVYLLILLPFMIVGTILAKKGLAKTEANQETVGFGVCLLIFSFLPAGILYIVCAKNNNNATVIEG